MSDQSTDLSSAGVVGQTSAVSGAGLLLPQLVQHLRQNRTGLREEWARRITEAELLTAMSPEEIFSEATTVYDSYVEVLETGSVEALQDYARDLSERIIPRGVETNEVVGIVLAAARRAGPVALREVPDGLRPAEPGARRLRARGQPDRQHRRRRLRAGTRAHHPSAAGGHPRAVDAGAAGARAVADPADHRRSGQPARPAGHRATTAGHSRQPGQGRRHRHHRCAHHRLDGGQPPRADRRRVAA